MRAVSVVGLVVVAGLLVACGGGGTTRKFARQDTGEAVTMTDLRREYLADRDAATQRWGGKTIKVQGIVGLTFDDHPEKPRVMLVADSLDFFVACWFHRSRAEEVRKLTRGDRVVVTGVLEGKTIVDEKDGKVSLTLQDCALLD